MAVAHPLLQLQDGDTFKQIGNPFQVTGELADAVTLALLLPFLLACHAFTVLCSSTQVLVMTGLEPFMRLMTSKKPYAQMLLSLFEFAFIDFLQT